MVLTISIDPDPGEVLALYLRIEDGIIHRTVQIEEGECYVDEDSDGRPLGMEVLVPEHLGVLSEQVAQRYNLPDVPRVMKKVTEQFVHA